MALESQHLLLPGPFLAQQSLACSGSTVLPATCARPSVCLWVVWGSWVQVLPGCEPVVLCLQERFVVHITDVLAVSMMLGITAQVKEAGIAWDKGEKRSKAVGRLGPA